MSTGVELIQASVEHRPALTNLLELYIHDFSEYVPVDVGEDGRFGYKDLPLYWSDSARLPFLARLDEQLVGFALVIRNSEADSSVDSWDMAEFFVMRRYRNRGIGAEFARQIWLRCPGMWQIRVMEMNLPARRFWDSTITRYSGQSALASRFVAANTPWHHFQLDTRR